MIRITETLVVSFENDEHRRYALLCGSFGFNMTMNAALQIDTRFVHPKGYIVRLDRQDDTTTSEFYEPHLMVSRKGTHVEWPRREDYDTPMHPDHYSDMEWQWLEGDEPSSTTSLEFLTRELYLWVKIRPHRLSTKAIDDYTLHGRESSSMSKNDGDYRS